MLHKLTAGLEGLVKTKARLQASTPHISIWCVSTKDNLAELPELVRLAARLGVPEVYVQRMTYFAQEPHEQYGMARQELASERHIVENNKVIILLTDGLPFGTTAEAVLAVADQAKAEGISIYTIGLGGDVDPHLLQQVATDPGKYYFAPQATDLEAIYEQIAILIPCG